SDRSRWISMRVSCVSTGCEYVCRIPLQVLTALLERPGEIVTREELAQRLWPTGTFVDFDKGLNAAVTRLRQTLSDSAETPRYVETVARRGYRLIAPVNAATSHEVPIETDVKQSRHGWKWPALAGL